MKRKRYQSDPTVREAMLKVFKDAFSNLNKSTTLPFIFVTKTEHFVEYFAWVWFPDTADIVITYEGNGIFEIMPRSEWKTKLKVPAIGTIGYIGKAKAEISHIRQIDFITDEYDEIFDEM